MATKNKEEKKTTVIQRRVEAGSPSDEGTVGYGSSEEEEFDGPSSSESSTRKSRQPQEQNQSQQSRKHLGVHPQVDHL